MNSVQNSEQNPKIQSNFRLFSTKFIFQPQNVLNFASDSHKQFEDFIEAFKKRIDIEISYAKNLQQCSKILDKHIQFDTGKTVSLICSAFRVQHEQRARQARQLAQSLRSEVYDICCETLRENQLSHKKYEKDIKKNNKQRISLEENFIHTKQKYESVNLDTQQLLLMKNIVKYTLLLPQQKKVKMITKTMESLKQRKQYEKLHSQTIKQYNQFAQIYNKETTTMLDTIEKNCREQVILQSDCMRKLIVCQISMFKNIQYDLINISKQMEHLDYQKDIEQFIKEIQISNGGLRIKDQLIDKSLLSQCLFLVEQDKCNFMIQIKRNKAFRKFITDYWKMINQKDFDKINKEIPIKQTNKEINNQQKISQSKQQMELQKQLPIQKIEQNTQNKLQIEISEKEKNQVKNEDNFQNINSGNKKQSIQNEQTQQASENKNIKQSSQKVFSQSSSIISKQKQNNSIQIDQKDLSPLPLQLKKLLGDSSYLGTDNEQIISSLNQVFKSIVEIIGWIWGSNPIKSSLSIQSLLIQFRNLLKDVRLHRLLAYLLIEQYRIQHKVLIQLEHSRIICRMIRIIFEKSLENHDIFICRGLLSLLFTFYELDEKKKNKLLLYQNSCIYDCQLWRRHDLWQACIFESTYEQMATLSIQKGQTQSQTNLRQKNMIFSQLASFCHYMIMMGISSKNVRIIVGRYCRLYEMSDEQNRDLSKMITNTYRQHKEIISVIL